MTPAFSLKTLAFAACALVGLSGQPSQAANISILNSYGPWSSYSRSSEEGRTTGVATRMSNGATVTIYREGETFAFGMSKESWRLQRGQTVEYRLRVGDLKYNGRFVAKSSNSIVVTKVPLSFIEAMIVSSDAEIVFAGERWTISLAGFSPALKDALRYDI